MIKALLFDLDETLTVHEAAYRESYASMGALAAEMAGVDAQKFAESAPRVVETVWQATDGAGFTNRSAFGGRDVLWAGPGDENEELRRLAPIVDQFRTDAWAALLGEQGVEDEATVRQLRERFPAEVWSRIRPFPDTAPALESVRDTFELVLVTNGMPSVQRTKLKHTGLDRFFDRAVVSGAIGEGKPAPSMFRAALEMAGTSAHEAVMFGDVPERDILGAQQMGIRAVWVNRAREQLAEGAPIADREVADLSQLRAVFDDLEPSGLYPV